MTYTTDVSLTTLCLFKKSIDHWDGSKLYKPQNNSTKHPPQKKTTESKNV